MFCSSLLQGHLQARQRRRRVLTVVKTKSAKQCHQVNKRAIQINKLVPGPSMGRTGLGPFSDRCRKGLGPFSDRCRTGLGPFSDQVWAGPGRGGASVPWRSELHRRTCSFDLHVYLVALLGRLRSHKVESTKLCKFLTTTTTLRDSGGWRRHELRKAGSQSGL